MQLRRRENQSTYSPDFFEELSSVLGLDELASKLFQTPDLLTSSLIFISGKSLAIGIFTTFPLANGTSNPELVYLKRSKNEKCYCIRNVAHWLDTYVTELC